MIYRHWPVRRCVGESVRSADAGDAQRCQTTLTRRTVRAMNPSPTFDHALLALLCCPETRQPLSFAPAGLLATLERARAAGQLVNRAGQPVAEPITEGLLRADGAVFYPMIEGIPLLTPDDAVRVPAS